MERRHFLAGAAAVGASAAIAPRLVSGAERAWDGSPVMYPDPAIEVVDDRFKK
jgi:hypothetical protein